MSSLVLNTDRSKIPRRDNEPTGEAETLVGRIDPKAMGSRALKESNREELDKKKKKAEKQREREAVGERSSKRKAGVDGGGRRYGDVLEATQDMEGLTYRPRTAETREVYELMLAAVHQSLGDQPQDMVRSAADMVLENLKDENLKDLDKKKEVEGLLGAVSTETFTQLVNLSKKITDYGEEAAKLDNEDEDGKPRTRADELDDDNNGVAVVFDEDEEDEDEAEGDFEIRDEDSDSDEDEGDEVEGTTTGVERPDDEAVEEEAIVLGGADKASGSTKSKGLTVHDIDGFWLQRLISSFYPDPVTAEGLTRDAMTLLSSDSSVRDLENGLVDLFNYDNFDLVATLTKNREIIVWGTKWARSDDDEKVNLGVTMREKGVGWIAKALTAGRGGAASGADRMDVDPKGPAAAAAAAKGPAKANIVPGTTAPAPRKTVDLASMQFAQGSRTMTNAKVKMPEGSFKRSKKGYDEIHVPEIKKKPFDQKELVPISKLPEWAREAFKGATSLNRIQSKLFPVAFGQDDPLLLCAPTGAGKVRSPLASKAIHR